MACSMPGFCVLHHLPEFAQTHIYWVNDAIQLSHPVSPPSSPALNLSQHQGLFQWVGIRWPKYWSFSFSISPSKGYSELISFRIDWFDLLAISSVQFSRSVVSDSLRPHESQHARPPCPSQTPGVHSDSRPSSQWCHPAISTSVVPFSSCPQSLPASESFPKNQLFSWGGQSAGVSALVSFLPKKSQGWSPSEWTGCISLQSKGLSRVFSNTTVQKHQFSLLYICTNSYVAYVYIHTKWYSHFGKEIGSFL